MFGIWLMHSVEFKCRYFALHAVILNSKEKIPWVYKYITCAIPWSISDTRLIVMSATSIENGHSLSECILCFMYCINTIFFIIWYKLSEISLSCHSIADIIENEICVQKVEPKEPSVSIPQEIIIRTRELVRLH